MNDRVGDLETRVGDLETTVRTLNTALDTETTNRHTAEQDLQNQLGALADLLTDNNTTTGYVIKYLNRLDADYTAKELVLQESIRDFNEFKSLPPKSNKYIAIWDTAWAVVAVAVPAMRLLPAIQKLEKAAAIEMASAKAFMKTPKLTARIATAVVKRHNVADVIVKANNIRDKSKKVEDVRTTVPVDTSRSPIKDLIKESNEAHKALEGVINTLDVEFAARIHSVLYKVPYQTKETLEAMAKRLMPPLDYFDDVQVEQLGRLYLWNILGEYAKRNVAIVTMRYRTGDAVGIDGFNDSQQEQIMEWFGPQSNWQGGRLAPIANIWVALAIWNVPRRSESSGGSIFGFG